LVVQSPDEQQGTQPNKFVAAPAALPANAALAASFAFTL